MKIHYPNITGSAIALNGFTGSLQGTSSWATNALTASRISITNDAAPTNRYIPFLSIAAGTGIAPSSSTVLTNADFSYIPASNTLSVTSSWANNAITSSYVNTLNQDVIINGTLFVGNEISGIQGQIIALTTRNYPFSGF